MRKPITIQEALDIINEEENKPQDRSEIDAIYIAPPEPDILTDKDSGDEEQAGLIDNLNGRQLRANAEIKLKSNMEVSYSNDDISEDNISPNKFSVHSSVVPDDSMSNHPPSNSGGQNTLDVDVNIIRNRDVQEKAAAQLCEQCVRNVEEFVWTVLPYFIQLHIRSSVTD
ncbi:hypothetical protein C0J52_17798 [Blattella germanica]|nr:hypothetical protein C0J52_17798 [Blattella germanica]